MNDDKEEIHFGKKDECMEEIARRNSNSWSQTVGTPDYNLCPCRGENPLESFTEIPNNTKTGECFFNYLTFLWFVSYLTPTSLVQSGAEPQVFDFDESRRHPVDFSPVKVWLWVLVVEVYSGRFMGHVHHVLPEFPEVEQVWSLTHLLHFLAISFFGGVHNQEA